MNINQQQLNSHLQQGIKPVYLVSGDEPLLMQECCDLLRNQFKQQGFLEREIYDIDAKFDWNSVYHSINSLSLFSDRKIIELRFKSSKIGDDGSKGLQDILGNLNPDIVILASMPKIDKATQNGKWFKALDNIGISVQLWPVERANLPSWIANRMQSAGIHASSDAIQFLADNVEGNLLAAKQEIDKLSLLADQQTIDLNSMMQLVSNSSRYTIFNLTDRCLSGDINASLRTFAGLQAEGMEATLMLWSLTRELRVIHRLQCAMEKGVSQFQAMQAERIFQNRQALYQSALKRLSRKKIERLLLKARQIDQSIKGINNESAWLHLEQMTVALNTNG